MMPTSNPVEAWESLFRAQVSIMRELRGGFSSNSMSMNEYDVLFNVIREPQGRIRLRDLNRNVLITQSSVSRLVDRLVQRGFLVKIDDRLDLRSTLIEITPDGRAEFTRAARTHMRNIQERMTGALDPDELRTLQYLCTKLRLGQAGGRGRDHDA
ncbi:MarR family winged helix-turn-helix transcriptional regulator [Pseudoclavibacter helvolus]|mgnify:CR=1 FL=1|uniref:DNA-binding MarR family transcriptional regulator n=1 Tax=Pseudoclavibacter helvolus TaxID=255205 RepID=A0A7W4YG52_9MICO|nr:MarR family transcriptional regulator [Pseudoclavibacter helvolus]MBB2959254.1 DNA-binding MarR family transcriptional regulator [Pseudoclavibacter helvolus]